MNEAFEMRFSCSVMQRIPEMILDFDHWEVSVTVNSRSRPKGSLVADSSKLECPVPTLIFGVDRVEISSSLNLGDRAAEQGAADV